MARQRLSRDKLFREGIDAKHIGSPKTPGGIVRILMDSEAGRFAVTLTKQPGHHKLIADIQQTIDAGIAGRYLSGNAVNCDPAAAVEMLQQRAMEEPEKYLGPLAMLGIRPEPPEIQA